jgi:phosphate transport system permease protein
MIPASPPPPESSAPAAAPSVRSRRFGRGMSTLTAHGEPMVWLTGGGLALAMAMIVGLLLLVLFQGLFTFWPSPVPRYTLTSGVVRMGEIAREDRFQPAEHVLAALPEAAREAARREVTAADGWAHRQLVRTGNFELSGEHFDWVSDFEIAHEDHPPWAVVMERMTWGRFYGEPAAFHLHHAGASSWPTTRARPTARAASSRPSSAPWS